TVRWTRSGTFASPPTGPFLASSACGADRGTRQSRRLRRRHRRRRHEWTGKPTWPGWSGVMTELRIAGRGWHNGLRAAAPWWHGRRRSGSGLATLIVGAGSAARTLMRDLRDCPDYGLWPVGLLDDNPGIRSVYGVPVLGTLADMRQTVRDRRIAAV